MTHELLLFVKVFLRIRVSMQAARPAAGATFAFAQIFARTLDVFGSCFFFFDMRDPANPLIACDGSQAVPCFANGSVGNKSFFQVFWQFMQYAVRQILIAH